MPVFGGLLIVAVLANKTAITDPLAYTFLIARLVQSCTHMASVSVPAVNVRFLAFALQMGIAVFWAVKLLIA